MDFKNFTVRWRNSFKCTKFIAIELYLWIGVWHVSAAFVYNKRKMMMFSKQFLLRLLFVIIYRKKKSWVQQWAAFFSLCCFNPIKLCEWRVKTPKLMQTATSSSRNRSRVCPHFFGRVMVFSGMGQNDISCAYVEFQGWHIKAMSFVGFYESCDSDRCWLFSPK